MLFKLRKFVKYELDDTSNNKILNKSNKIDILMSYDKV